MCSAVDTTTTCFWLPCEDSNSGLLVQSQVCSRLHHSARPGPSARQHLPPVLATWRQSRKVDGLNIRSPKGGLGLATRRIATLPTFRTCPRHDSNVHASA